MRAAAGGSWSSYASFSQSPFSGGKSQRLLSDRPQNGACALCGLIVGIVTADDGCSLVFAGVRGYYRVYFLAGVEEVLVPVGTGFVDVETRVVIKRQFQSAGLADTSLGRAQTAFQFAPFVAGELGVRQFLKGLIDLFFGQF